MTAATVAIKAQRGFFALSLRTLLVQVVGFASSVVLARALSPADFGLFAIAASVLQVYNLASAAGLGTPIVRSKEDLSELQLNRLFTFYLGVSLLLYGALYATAPFVLMLYKAAREDLVALVRVVGLTLPLRIVSCVPKSLMERALEFPKVARVDVLEEVTYNLGCVVMVLTGLHVWALVLATLLRDLMGVLAAYRLRPCRPALALPTQEIRYLVHVGVGSQMMNLVILLQSTVEPVLVGSLCGPAALGYVNWAKSTSQRPGAWLEPVQRITFPLFSRLQHDEGELKTAIERCIGLLAAVALPAMGFMIAIAAPTIAFVYTRKWLPALPPLYFFCLVPALAPWYIPLFEAITATAKPKALYRLALISGAAYWIVSIPAVLLLGYAGAPVAAGIVQVLMIGLYYHYLSGPVRPRLLTPAVLPAVHALVGYTLTVLVMKSMAVSLMSYASALALSGTLVLLAGLVIQPQTARDLLDIVRRHRRS